MKLIDTHCHLDVPEFDGDRKRIMQNCQARGIQKIIIPGVCQGSWSHILAISSRFDSLYSALGLHPCFLEECDLSAIKTLERMLDNHPSVVAIGETGLDFFIKHYNEERQTEFFKRQVELARRFQLPLILHVRKAHDQVTSLLRKKKFHCGGVVHCYSGSMQQAKRYLDLGFKLGIGGVITYPRSIRLREIAAELPLTSFVLETDAPDLPPSGRERQRNSPEFLSEIFDSFAAIRPESKTETERRLYQNTRELFRRLKD